MHQNAPVVTTVSDPKAYKPKQFGNGWSVRKKGDKYEAGNSRGSRPRVLKDTKEEAELYAQFQSALQNNRYLPVMNMKDSKLTLIQDIAALVEKASDDDVAQLKYLTSLDSSTKKVLHHIAPSIVSAQDKHKVETMVLAMLQKLHPARSDWTVGMMVDTHLEAKRAAIALLPPGKRRKQAQGHLKQVEEVGLHITVYFGAKTDIDSLTPDDITKRWKPKYILDHAGMGQNGGDLAPATVAARINILAQFFNTVAALGWPGASPAHFVKVGRLNEPVALNFEEYSGVVAALLLTDLHSCAQFIDEVLASMRSNEAQWLADSDFNLETMEVKADPKASSEYGKEGSGTTIGDNPRKRVIEIINAYYQWLMYFREKGLVRIPGRDRQVHLKAIHEARKIAGVKRWGKHGTGRHTGANVMRKWGIPEAKIQEQLGHKIGSNTFDVNYKAVLEDKDAGGIIVVTPYGFGLIDKPYDFFVAPEDIDHLGHRLKLTERHRPIIEEFQPKLQAIYARIKAKLGIQ
jgi:integrase